ALGPTHRGRTCDHRHRAEGIESDSQHEHLRSRRFVGSNHCGHERGHARQYRRDVVTHAQLAGSQSPSRAWLWPPGNGGSIPLLLERKDGTLVAWYCWFYAPRTGGAYDSHHRTTGIAGCTRRRGGGVAARGAGAAMARRSTGNAMKGIAEWLASIGLSEYAQR